MRMLTCRVPERVVERLDSLIPTLSDNAMLAAWGTVNRSKVLRLAIMKGLEVLEAEHEPKRRRRK